jgi:hypothetical protein
LNIDKLTSPEKNQETACEPAGMARAQHIRTQSKGRGERTSPSISGLDMMG